jgi:N-acyl homoserine lactone hydrolase
MVGIHAEKSQFSNWEDVFSQPGTIKSRTLKAGSIKSRLSTVINLKNPAPGNPADKTVMVPVLAHLLWHPEFDWFLIDTGLDSSFTKPGGSFKGLLKTPYFKNRYLVNSGEGIDEQLAGLDIEPKALFITHAHEHVSGVGVLPNGITRMCGAGEKDTNLFPLVYSTFFRDSPFQTFDFGEAGTMPVFGKSLDIFGDGSLWALPTAGHTAGHISYLANTIAGLVFFTGDACISENGLKIGVEPGKTDNPAAGRESFLKIKEFAGKYPQVRLVFGHECGEYKISY